MEEYVEGMDKLTKGIGLPGSLGRRGFIGAGLALAGAAALRPVSSALASVAFEGTSATWLSHYTYVAPDLAETRDWYHEVFGMQIGHQDASEAHLWYGDEGGDTLMIVRQAGAGEDAPRIERCGFVVDNWDTNAVGAELRRRGLRPRPDTDRGFWFDDPEGNEIGVFAKDFVTRPSAPPEQPSLWNTQSANHIVMTSNDYRKLGDWYLDLFELRETMDTGRDVYQWFGDTVWIPTAVAEGAQTSFELKTLDHVAYTISDYDSADVEAELRRRKLIEAEADVAGSLGINCVDINGFKTQVCDKNLVPDAEGRRG